MFIVHLAVHAVKSKVEISQNFVAFSEYMNFKSQKQFLELSILPKNERKQEKNTLKAFFFAFFLRSLEELRIPKIVFEIY